MIWRVLGVLVILVVGVGAGYGLATGDPMAVVDASGEIVLGDESSANPGGSFDRIEIDGNTMTVVMENFDTHTIRITTPEGDTFEKIVGGVDDVTMDRPAYTFEKDGAFPSGVYTVEAKSTMGKYQPFDESHSLNLTNT